MRMRRVDRTGQDERTQLSTLRTVHPQAYSLYLKGRYNARILTEEGQSKAKLIFY